ncbi:MULTISPECIES: GlmL-related ornithine degradation protein [Psychrilyobacter]|uniref:DNA mismatch repair protein MutL n=1 Tax=Psychrilyobacter piezotolerans TaxID=2293438 RepID=A0ABX9KL40_9FUSO|nr:MULTISPECIES: GlmL-related ornithine degradation protein [Psychrilyobacter]MCS5420381.1 GlmL-related ornithine degradation protein [Psychrilyobacter sp. S5]NDI76385.1 DNA mismatch repair protein MutL [Psychrilyobacter piezotolerans]RDE65981.1 DNA mismatch repair protein MutL [Psychrilyobacter sp. S5]REI43159.1 DNA mismatch repair protein MutL [Psychrilyobacter piezotolerans]
MKIDVLVAEIGSTTTVVNAFGNLEGENPKFIGQGQAPTTVDQGDVNLGLMDATYDLEEKLGIRELEYDEFLATSSAAGGLKMTVHGLVYDMTAKAAKEAALGAGANIHMVTSGKLRRTDLKEIEKIKPNIILLAGGVDYGERDTALYNAELLAKLNLDVPVIYAGNIQNCEEIKLIFEDYGKEDLLKIVENVYPKIDQLNVEPVRRVIQDVFEEHIIHAPGMERVRDIVSGPIVPTPGAVMEGSKILKEVIGDLVTIDVGGATTDIHSVTDGSEEITRILISPEPIAKRTVEGDLGVYVNMKNIVEIIGEKNLAKELTLEEEELTEHLLNFPPIPKSEVEMKLVEILTEKAVIMSIHRHAGGYRHLFGETKKTLAEGKDLTSVKWIIGTGGALTKLPNRLEILKKVAMSNKGDKLLPTPEVKILIDNDYIMASLGVLSKYNKESAVKLLKKSLRIEEVETL